MPRCVEPFIMGWSSGSAGRERSDEHQSQRAVLASSWSDAMRRVVLQMAVTIDGFVHSAKGYEDWGCPPDEDEVVAWKVASLREGGTHLTGRLTYEAITAGWPNTTRVFAEVVNEIPKVVFSNTPSAGSGCCSTTVNLTRTRDRGEIGHARRHFVHVDVTGRVR